MWAVFEGQWKEKLDSLDSFRKLKESIDSAFELESLLTNPGTIIERESVLEILSNVGEKISNLLEEVETNDK